VTVIVAVPADTPVTRPSAFTVATALSLLDHIRALFVALLGAMVATSVSAEPATSVAAVLFRLTPDTDT
jgi:hypothetical protein